MHIDTRSTHEALTNRSLDNRKPYRTKSQKVEARGSAHTCKDGAHRSPAPVTIHKAFQERGKQ